MNRDLEYLCTDNLGQKLYWEKSFIFNDGCGDPDPELIPVRLSLPKPPKPELIANYGLPRDEQIFRRIDTPQKLIDLENQVKREFELKNKQNSKFTITGHKLIKEFWDRFEDDPDYYRDEKKFIKNIYWWKTYGYWIYIDGVATFIPPWFFSYLNLFYVPDSPTGYPEYRDVDRRRYLVRLYAYTTTETFVDVDSDGYALKGPDGKYNMKDIGLRTLYGVAFPKNRRMGATLQAANNGWCMVSEAYSKHSSYVSKDEKTARDIWEEKFLKAWKRYPLWLKPTWNGNNNPSSEISLIPPSNDPGYPCLDSSIKYVESAGETSIDGTRQDYITQDEVGKLSGGGRVDVFARYEVNKQCLATGDGAIIHGFTDVFSTCEDLDDGAANFMKICDMSNFYERFDTSGQTKSGVVLMFMPACDGLAGFIDPFGNSVVDDPDERLIELGKKNPKKYTYAAYGVGARNYILNRRYSLGKSKNVNHQKKLLSDRRKQPLKMEDVWVDSGGDMGFPVDVINRRVAELRQSKVKPCIKGYFEWQNNDPNSGVVEFIRSESGPFNLSYLPPMEYRNRRVYSTCFSAIAQDDIPCYTPYFPDKFTCGADPFKFDNKSEAKLRATKSKMSNGGIAILRHPDSRIDDNIEDYENMESYDFVCTYNFRRNTDDAFCEDVLMACVFFGAMLYPETNITNLWKHFIKRGYGGYLKYDIDLNTGRVKDKPGATSLKNSKQDLFSLFSTYLNRRAHKCNHDDLLKEAISVKNLDDMTYYDLLTSAMYAVMGFNGGYSTALSNQSKMTGRNVMDYYKVFTQ